MSGSFENLPSDRERWDAKYRAGLGVDLDEPDPFVLRALERLAADGVPPGDALDLASGAGRHALLLARRGWRTCAHDVSPVGLERLAAHARAAGSRIATRCVDLERDPPPARDAERFDLVVVANFLARRLGAPLAAWVRPGGFVAYVTFTRDWPGEKPPPEFRLAPGELAAGLPGFETVLTDEAQGRAGLLARRLAP